MESQAHFLARIAYCGFKSENEAEGLRGLTDEELALYHIGDHFAPRVWVVPSVYNTPKTKWSTMPLGDAF